MPENELPPGWYTEPGGPRRYWDGALWLVPAEDPPDHADGSMPVRGRKRGVWLSMVAAGVVVVLGGGIYLVVTTTRAQHEREEAERVAAVEAEATAKAEAEAEAEAESRAEAAAEEEAQRQAQVALELAELERTVREDMDESMLNSGEGWEVVTSGDLYFRFARDDEFTCGYWDCIGVVVVSVSGCPGGVYVQAAIENDGGVVVGSTNAIIGGLQPQQTGAELLEDFNGVGSTFRVNDVQCM